MDPVLNEANSRIDKAILHLKSELAIIRAGRANPTLIENISVSAYGGQMKLMEVGTISAPQPTLLTVSVWDASLVGDVQKAIQEAKMGLNPSVDGQTVRVPIPPLSEERREEFIKLANHKGEQTRIEIRQIRGDLRDSWKKEEESGSIGEDEFRRREKLLQDLVDKSVVAVDEMVSQKEEELRTV